MSDSGVVIIVILSCVGFYYFFRWAFADQREAREKAKKEFDDLYGDYLYAVEKLFPGAKGLHFKNHTTRRCSIKNSNYQVVGEWVIEVDNRSYRNWYITLSGNIGKYFSAKM